MTTNNIQIQWQNGFVGQRQGQQSRQGDWICVQCNNLNFSFRKRCNRCKVQSREDNQEQIRQAYEYYNEYYRQLDGNDSQAPQTLTPIQSGHSTQYSNYSFPNQPTINAQCEDIYYSLELPSVSPYKRRYKAPQNIMIKTQISQGWSSDDQSNQSKQQYLSEYCWQNILVDDYQEDYEDVKDSLNNCQEDYSEMERIVQNIVL